MHIPLHDYWSLLARYLRAQRGKTTLLTVLLFVSIGLQLVNPQIVRRFIDAAQAGSAPNTLLVWWCHTAVPPCAAPIRSSC